eukprot:gene2765-3018_t
MIALLIWLSYYLLVEASGKNKEYKYCNGRGYRDAYGLCRCSANYFGQACEYKSCPFGKSWLSAPVEDGVRNSPLVPCSNMGFCNIHTGLCECRNGFEGRACERMACPSTAVNNLTLPCSGHGTCLTMRDAGRSFNGLNLVRAPLEYGNWEADRVQGCYCDYGYEGYDCSRLSCPKGRDPSVVSTPYDTGKANVFIQSSANCCKVVVNLNVEEVFVLQCQGSEGYFALQFLGEYTDPIPFDADPAYLILTLQTILHSRLLDNAVNIRMPINPVTGLPQLCISDAVVSTKISFDGADFGDWPPIRVLRNTSSSLLWGTDSERQLALFGSTSQAVLRMSTQHFLRCPQCSHCSGKVYFSYEGVDVSGGVNISSSGATSAIRNAILDVYALQQAQWASLNVSVSYSLEDRICSSTGSNLITIEVVSDFGNLPFLSLIDGSDGSANLSFTTNGGNSSVYECSRQGSCDYTTGLCTCASSFVASGLTLKNPDLQGISNAGGGFLYRSLSGDGRGDIGSRGDCGYIDTSVRACFDTQDLPVCSGHGICANRTSGSGYECQCFDGWYGLTCAVGDCPKGRAWFDEPFSSKAAHRPVECSNAGVCNRDTGLCSCQTGFAGAACEIFDCPRSGASPCSGHGNCLSIRSFFAQYDYSYGNASTDAWTWDIDSSTWDAERWFVCSCSAQVGILDSADLLHPSSGPRGTVSGFASPSAPLPGFFNYDCAGRNCPLGHDTRPYHPDTQFEEQRVVCAKSQFNHTDGFYFELFGSFSLPIPTWAPIGWIKRALEHNGHIGNVTIYLPNADIDNIHTACSLDVNQTHGGFVVRFVTELGTLPMLRAVPLTFDTFSMAGKRGKSVHAGADRLVYTGTSSLPEAEDVSIFSLQRGYAVLSECSGAALGYCDRIHGYCLCNHPRISSDGETGPGGRGDCSYFPPNPPHNDTMHIFGLYK